ncbi:MAG: hypothetical protein GX456_20120 [Verrucomicrobia bacterium]|nr:hypothetical protein [Verrucomicrobiota bacterium]
MHKQRACPHIGTEWYLHRLRQPRIETRDNFPATPQPMDYAAFCAARGLRRGFVREVRLCRRHPEVLGICRAGAEPRGGVGSCWTRSRAALATDY